MSVTVGVEHIPLRTTGPLYRLVCAALGGMHLALVVIMAWWAAILLAPVPTFATSDSYRYFPAHWPHTEPGWALMFLVGALVGMPGFWPVYGRPHNSRVTTMRIASASGLAMAHGWLAYVIADANPGSTGTGVYLTCALLGLFRIACEVGLVLIVLEAE